MALPRPLIDLHYCGDAIAHVELRIIIADQYDTKVLTTVQSQRRKDER